MLQEDLVNKRVKAREKPRSKVSNGGGSSFGKVPTPAPVSSRTISRSLVPPRLLTPLTAVKEANTLVTQLRAQFRPEPQRRLAAKSLPLTRQLSDDIGALDSDFTRIKEESSDAIELDSVGVRVLFSRAYSLSANALNSQVSTHQLVPHTSSSSAPYQGRRSFKLEKIMNKAREEVSSEHRILDRLIARKNAPVPFVSKGKEEELDQIIMILCGCEVSFILHEFFITG